MALINPNKKVEEQFARLSKDLVNLQKYIRTSLTDDSVDLQTKADIIQEIVRFYSTRGPILGNFTLTYKGKTFFEGAPLEKKEFSQCGIFRFLSAIKKSFDEKDYTRIARNLYVYYYINMPNFHIVTEEDMRSLFDKLKDITKVNELASF